MHRKCRNKSEKCNCFEEEAEKVPEEENVPESGEYLLVNKVLLNPTKEFVEPA